MPGPLPGMDPYLENRSWWPDFHQRFITYLADALQPAIRPRYRARIGERVYLFNPNEQQSYYPDVSLLRHPRPGRIAGAPPGVLDAAVAPQTMPYILVRPKIDYREPYLEIFNASGDVVATIEVLSPINKMPGEGRERYWEKRRQLLQTQVHLVEIDLWSQGIPIIQLDPEEEDGLPPARYHVVVNRFPYRYEAELYAIPLQKPLPTISIPLRAPDPDVPLNLQEVFNRCYDNGDYADMIDYGKPPPAPLSDEERFWLRRALAEQGVMQAER